ncbi:MAG TPA: response regulator [Cyanobacteria bacterium UBA11159]|nr:response regulator [Cyanobacteria bacterium UBA11366]HBR75852.1 response regulator [Cyanobacteria bacterium UBA11159]HBS69274.1 response regulator [Cyanobacteria bacterium UBA11153]HCA96629.1 response regulator [Cyanobacteria bacterium UBA9226]
MKKILIIEDERFIRDNLIELLEIEGFSALGSENGKMGVALAETYQPNLILCDVMMPELDGYGVFAEMRSNPLTANIPFLFLTASADMNNIEKIKELGMNEYILKPFNVESFLQTIEKYLTD